MFRKNEKEKAIDSFLKVEFETTDFLFLLICTELPDFNPSGILTPGYTRGWGSPLPVVRPAFAGRQVCLLALPYHNKLIINIL
ncbi:MAG: hypothetical protein ACFCUU_01165 [Cyclobacteriaceae bacterium]